MGTYKDYSSLAVMRAAALTQSKRRGGTDHEYVVGCFALVNGRVTLIAVESGPAYDVYEQLTDLACRFARWRTKQAAWQWLSIRNRPDWRVIHLGRLDVLSTPRH